MAFIDPAQLDLEDRVVAINRITKVVKGGRNMRFAALVVVGDRNGQRILVLAKDIAGLVCRQGSHRTLTGHHQRQSHSQCFCHPVSEKRRYCVTLTHT